MKMSMIDNVSPVSFELGYDEDTESMIEVRDVSLKQAPPAPRGVCSHLRIDNAFSEPSCVFSSIRGAHLCIIEFDLLKVEWYFV
jgi:hypothetical protein